MGAGESTQPHQCTSNGHTQFFSKGSNQRRSIAGDGTAADRRGLRAYRHAIERGVVLRPLGDILYWMPPYCVGEQELLHLAAVTTSAIEEATRA